MNIFSRFRMAFKALTGSVVRTVATFSEAWLERTPSYNETSFKAMVKNGWRKNELIFACISKTANTAAQVSLVVQRKADKAHLPDHPLQQLLSQPNEYMSEFDFWVSVIIYQKLAGRAIYEKQRNRAGDVIKLWPLRPDWVAVVPARPFIGHYIYQPPGFDPIVLMPEDVLDFPVWDPMTPYNPYPPVAVLARVGDIDNAVTDYIKLFLDRGGVPPFLLKSTQRLQDAQVADIRRRWRERYGGYEKWIDPIVLDSDAEYQKVGFDFREMGLEVVDARNEAKICMVLDVPPILVGAKVGLDRATYSNYGEARQSWWEDSLLPLYSSYHDVITNGLVIEFRDSSIEVAWDFSKVSALQEERDSRWKRATEAFRSGSITVNEFCTEVGLPTKGPAGDVYLRSATMIEVPAKTTRTTLSLPISGNGKEAKAVGEPLAHSKRGETERAFTKEVEAFLTAQQLRVRRELEKTY